MCPCTEMTEGDAGKSRRPSVTDSWVALDARGAGSPIRGLLSGTGGLVICFAFEEGCYAYIVGDRRPEKRWWVRQEVTCES